MSRREKISIPALIAALCACIATHFTSCTIFEEQIDRASSRVANVVTGYCENFTQDQRQQFGDLVRAKSVPHTISVSCAGDP